MTVTNSAPRFTQKLPKLISMRLNEVRTLALPTIMDDENNPVTVVTLSKPDFVTYANL